MKIQPIQIWKDGELKTADTLTCYVVSDNLKDSATFYYSLSSEAGSLAQGNLTMGGTDYEGWQTNEYAWQWVAGKLGLTIIGEDPAPSVDAPAE